MELSQLISQLQTIATLYAEVLICIVAAGVLGWIVGLMVQRSRHRRQLTVQSQQWRKRLQTIEESSRNDVVHLEEQLQSLAKETKTLQTSNRALADSLKKNDTNIQKARAEAIELNRQHAETQERFQRTIEQKDLEIAELCKSLNIEPLATDNKRSAADANAAASLTKLTNAIADSDLADADTIAITPAQLPGNEITSLKNTTVKSTSLNGSNKKRLPSDTSDHDTSLDDTSDLSEFGLEESTVAMDEDALALAQKSFKSQQRD